MPHATGLSANPQAGRAGRRSSTHRAAIPRGLPTSQRVPHPHTSAATWHRADDLLGGLVVADDVVRVLLRLAELHINLGLLAFPPGICGNAAPLLRAFHVKLPGITEYIFPRYFLSQRL